MNREFYVDLAANGLRMPIGSDLVLHEEPDPERVRKDGRALGRVVERAARRWATPLAIPLMDLRLEKFDLLAMAGIDEAKAEAFHFSAPMDHMMLGALCGEQTVPLCAGSAARDAAIACISALPDLVPVGMAIGPFSLATRLMADPITATALAGRGTEAEDSADVKLLWQCLRAAESAVLRSLRSQIERGARAMMICEPAACTAFISPRQLRAGSKIFERVVMDPNLRLKAYLDEMGCDLIFHDCGELIDPMIEAFGWRIHPRVLSLGSSRKLWEDARLIPEDVVLYGNLPSKLFYSDDAMPVEEVARRTEDLVARMKVCGHPHIVGSECDVLFVPDAHEAILKKVDAMMAGSVAG